MASLLRASGLALPAMAVAGSLAALIVRWLRAGPVLLSGLLILAAADALGGLVRTVALSARTGPCTARAPGSPRPGWWR